MKSSTHKSRFLRRGFAAWCVIIVAESLHGTARELWLKPLVGDFRARQMAFFSGMLLILSISVLFVRWFQAGSPRQFLKIGLLWLVLTLAFELCLGRFVLDYSWARIWEDYNLMKGGLMGFGLLWMLIAPLFAARLRRLPFDSGVQ